jgi:DNA polymerase elongation subunit (family B)
MYGSVYYDMKKSIIHWSEYDVDTNERTFKSKKWIPDYYIETEEETKLKSQTGKYLKRIDQDTELLEKVAKLEREYSKMDVKKLKGREKSDYERFAENKTSWSAWERKDKIKKLKASGVKIYGSDLSAENKFILENWPNDIEETVPDHKIGFIDIECESEEGFPNAETVPERVNLITIHDSSTEINHVFGLEQGYKTDRKDVKYMKCDTEEKLLKEFCNIMQEIKPDVLSGWNSRGKTGGYDIPYLFNRILLICDKVDIVRYKQALLEKSDDSYDTIKESEKKFKWIKKLSPYNSVKLKKSMSKDRQTKQMKPVTEYQIQGVTDYDSMEVYQQFEQNQKESYRLDDIAFDELKEKKHELGCTFKEAYEPKRWKRFVEYNIQDTELLVKLEKKKGYLKQAICLSYKCHCQFRDNFGTVAKQECAAYYFLFKNKIIMSDRADDIVDGGTFPGAYVMTPIPGMYEWTIDVDIASLYPSLMRGINISPDTKLFEIIYPDDFSPKNTERLEMLVNDYPNDPIELEYSLQHKNGETVPHFEDSTIKKYLDALNENEDYLPSIKTGKIQKIVKVHFPIPDNHIFVLEKKCPEFEVAIKGKTDIQMMTVAKIAKLIRKNDWFVSGANVVFQNSNKKRGFIPQILDTWYDQRVVDKGLEKKYKKKAQAIAENGKDEEFDGSIEVTVIIDDIPMKKYITEDENVNYLENKRLAGIHYNKQWSCKILLNSLYGAISTHYCRFYDISLAKSVTFSGQMVIKKNGTMINKYLKEGLFSRKIIKDSFKIDKSMEIPDVLAYTDTDSCYLSFGKLMDKLNVANDYKKRLKITRFLARMTLDALDLYNETYFTKTFNAPNYIFWDQELVSDRAVFVKKKKYVCHIVEENGNPVDDLLVKGLEIVRSSTPKKCRESLRETVLRVLKWGSTEKDIKDFSKNIFNEFMTWDVSDITLPKSCNNLKKFDMCSGGGLSFKKGAPQHMKGAIAYNYYLRHYNIKGIEPIKEKDKFKLVIMKKNDVYRNINSIGYVDNIPKEFGITKDEVDYRQHFRLAFAQPMENILNAVGWRLPDFTVNREEIDDLFE